jgi:hypothetical protein
VKRLRTRCDVVCGSADRPAASIIRYRGVMQAVSPVGRMVSPRVRLTGPCGSESWIRRQTAERARVASVVANRSPMIAGVAVLGGVAAVVALIVARAVAVAEEQVLEAEAESLERRLESRLDALDARLARIEEQLHAFEHLRGGKGCRHDRPDDTPCGRC